MALVILVLLGGVVGAALFFSWRRSESHARRVAANIAGTIALLCLLLGVSAVAFFFRPLTP